MGEIGLKMKSKFFFVIVALFAISLSSGCGESNQDNSTLVGVVKNSHCVTGGKCLYEKSADIKIRIQPNNKSLAYEIIYIEDKNVAAHSFNTLNNCVIVSSENFMCHGLKRSNKHIEFDPHIFPFDYVTFAWVGNLLGNEKILINEMSGIKFMEKWDSWVGWPAIVIISFLLLMLVGISESIYDSK